MISNIIFMVFNWILIDKLAIGTPITSNKEKVLLEEKGIKTILDLRNSNDFNVIDYQKHIENLSDFVYENFPLPDHKSCRFAETFEIKQAVDLLHSSLSKGAVFMHCHASIERSPLISVAFLMKTRRLNIIQAYEYVKQQNKSTNISIEQLKKI